MTQAFNLSQLANNLDSSGRLDATDGLVNAVPVANGGTGVTTSTGSGSVVFSTSPTLEGTPLAPTAEYGTSNTQIASTAFVANAINGFIVKTEDIEDDAVTIPKLSATGTAGGSTFLRGDNTWSVVPNTGIASSGQSWQNFTSSRSSGTTYTNSTGKPIMVNVVASNGSYGTTTLTVSGLVVGRCSNPTTSSGALSTMSAIVPDGQTYSASGDISTWFELR